MRIQNPGSDGDDWVWIRGSRYAVEAGEVDLPERAAEALADSYETSVSELQVTETCEVVKSDGDVCGRELPCSYHSED